MAFARPALIIATLVLEVSANPVCLNIIYQMELVQLAQINAYLVHLLQFVQIVLQVSLYLVMEHVLHVLKDAPSAQV